MHTRGERGAAGLFGMVAVFAAAAVVITVIMLFVTGVAQRGILPRLKGRAERAIPPSVEVQALESEIGVGPEGVGTALDSLRALKQQIRVGSQMLDARITDLQQETARLESERTFADRDAEARIAKLAKVYSGMKPEAAARIMIYLDDDTFTKVLNKLNQRQAGKILAYIDPVRVARLTRDAARSTADSSY